MVGTIFDDESEQVAHDSTSKRSNERVRQNSEWTCSLDLRVSVEELDSMWIGLRHVVASLIHKAKTQNRVRPGSCDIEARRERKDRQTENILDAHKLVCLKT
jgi:hypothetical protein